MYTGIHLSFLKTKALKLREPITEDLCSASTFMLSLSEFLHVSDDSRVACSDHCVMTNPDLLLIMSHLQQL
jgi:hypothetical protein